MNTANTAPNFPKSFMGHCAWNSATAPVSMAVSNARKYQGTYNGMPDTVFQASSHPRSLATRSNERVAFA